jgi:hypothetical protein
LRQRLHVRELPTVANRPASLGLFPSSHVGDDLLDAVELRELTGFVISVFRQ